MPSQKLVRQGLQNQQLDENRAIRSMQSKERIRALEKAIDEDMRREQQETKTLGPGVSDLHLKNRQSSKPTNLLLLNRQSHQSQSQQQKELSPIKEMHKYHSVKQIDFGLIERVIPSFTQVSRSRNESDFQTAQTSINKKSTNPTLPPLSRHVKQIASQAQIHQKSSRLQRLLPSKPPLDARAQQSLKRYVQSNLKARNWRNNSFHALKAAKPDDRLVQKILNQDLLEQTLAVGCSKQARSQALGSTKTKSLDHRTMKSFLQTPNRRVEGKLSMNEKIQLSNEKKRERANLATKSIRLLRKKNK